MQLYRQLVEEPAYDKDAVWLWKGHCLQQLAYSAPNAQERRDYVDHAIECMAYSILKASYTSILKASYTSMLKASYTSMQERRDYVDHAIECTYA